MYELLLDNKNGNVWDIGDSASDIAWKTGRAGKAGSLEFSFIKNPLYQHKAFTVNNGDVVRFKKDNSSIFYGYIFNIEEGSGDEVKITAYDQIRYLLNNATYVFKNSTASSILRRLAADFKLTLGKVDDTGYAVPSMIEDGQKLLDIVCKALDATLTQTGRNYFLFDDFGALSLRLSDDFLMDFYLGPESLLYDFSAKRSIDSDTFNRIKLYRDNQNTGRREVYQLDDSGSMAKWGLLQLYQSVNENYNGAQINQMLNGLMALKNRESKSLQLEALGEVSVRAGCYIPVVIEEFGINQPFLIEECTHNFKGSEHTMSLELKVI